METVIGLFNRYEGADKAVEAWELAGFPEGSSVVSRDKAVRERVERVEPSDWVNDLAVGASAGAVSGALAGGVAGIFIGAMGRLGSGTALAAAVLVIALGAAAAGMLIGMAIGVVLGAFIGPGFPHQVHIYAERVRRGGILVTMRAPDSYAANIARNIMCDSGAVDINRRTNELSAASEWAGFQEDVWPEGDAPSTWIHIHRHVAPCDPTR